MKYLRLTNGHKNKKIKKAFVFISKDAKNHSGDQCSRCEVIQ